MLEIRRDFDLAQESLGAEYRTELRIENLDGDFSIVFEIVREVDSRHAAASKLALDSIPIEETGCDVAGDGSHCWAIPDYFRASRGARSLTSSNHPVATTSLDRPFVPAVRTRNVRVLGS